MKIPQKLFRGASVSKNRKGIALVTVLTVMALTTILVLTFFSLATSENRASNTYSNGLQAQQVAEQAINMVIAQIREATADPRSTEDYVWASQPGAIRAWNGSGVLQGIFKLYSDDVMKSAQVSEMTDDFADLGAWAGNPDVFVDLNEPVIRGDKVYYPIVNPTASVLPEWPNEINGENRGVEGFSYDSLTVEGGLFGDKAASISGAKDGHLAMPVKWLYQLADGTLGVAAENGSRASGYKFEAISGSGVPSVENQIVARFAFWADDESSKLNLNTHAGGLAWDIPKAGGEIDMDMGRHQPAKNEWQRYPGHPATTHIGPALSPGVRDIVYDRDAMEMLFDIVPRIVGGGSESGTRVLSVGGQFRQGEENGLIPDTEPLFPSLDDMIMRSDREPHDFPDSTGNPVPADELTEYLERAKFFITTYSRAPEVSMFNVPKVAIWPIYNAEKGDSKYETHLTPFDQLIHYCATVGRKGNDDLDYIFRREQADSATYDFDDITRNQELFDYIYDQMDREVPGYGRSFVQKYGNKEVKQIITLIFDYIRSTNLHDDTLFGEDFEEAFQEENDADHITYTNSRDDAEKGFGHKGHGQVTPIVIDDQKGLGRFFSLASAGIVVGTVAEPGPIGSRFPGINGYQKGPGEFYENPSLQAFGNLPPLPDRIKKSETSTHPTWLSNLQTTNPDEFEAAFDPTQWNWQLCFLHPNLNFATNLGAWRRTKFTDNLRNGFSDSDLLAMRLNPGEKLVQASLVFNLFSPSIGWNSVNPDLEIHIKKERGMTFSSSSNVEFLGFTPAVDRPSGIDPDTFVWSTNWVKPTRNAGSRSWGGLLSFGYTMSALQVNQNGGRNAAKNVWFQMRDARNALHPLDPNEVTLPPNTPPNGGFPNRDIKSRYSALDRGYDHIVSSLGAVKRGDVGNVTNVAQSYRYDLVTVPFKVGQNVTFNSGEVKFTFYNGQNYAESSASDSGDTGYNDRTMVQEITLEFPTFTEPTPAMAGGTPGHVNDFKALVRDSQGPLGRASMTADPANALVDDGNTGFTLPTRSGGYSADRDGRTPPIGRMGELVTRWNGSNIYINGRVNNDQEPVPGSDIVQAVGVPHGDMRLVAAKRTIDSSYSNFFAPHRFYDAEPHAHSFTNSVGVATSAFNTNRDENKRHLILPDLADVQAERRNGRRAKTAPYRNQAIPLPFFGVEEGQRYGDFDNGAGTMIDGPYINKPDEGNVHALKTKYEQSVAGFWESKREYGEFPYFSNPELAESGGAAYFSPNRIVSGPGMFGSLPTGVEDGEPWRTLLFRPNVVGKDYDSHPGAEDPPDHLIMEMFWMPVVEPYAISEPLSTAGKVNMNYQMVPFLHVDRSTALRGVFRSEYMLCIPEKWHASYKHQRGRGEGYHWRDSPRDGNLQGKQLRSVIMEEDTLAQFEKHFNEGADIFKYSSQICEIHLIPQELSERLGTNNSVGSYTPTVEEMENGSYWSDHSLVGDNSRERPYTNIQTRLTTRSNTFKVHYRAQVVKQARRDDDDYSSWEPLTDSVQAEYRGSSIVERFVDPNDETLTVDFATEGTERLNPFYQYRVVNPRRFAP